jgi:hypothetical protein
MGVMMLRATVQEGCAAEAEEAARTMFAAIERAAPEGVRYASCRAADGVTFVVLLQLDGEDDPLPALPEVQAFRAALPGWLAGPPTPEQLEVVGSYRLF